MNGARIVITRVFDDDRLGSQIESKMENLGRAVGRRAQRLVPKRTWALHDSIDAVTKRSGARVTTTISAGNASVGYALHVERGTSRMRAQPYLRPALMQSSGRDFAPTQGLTVHGVASPTTRRTRARARGRRMQ